MTRRNTSPGPVTALQQAILEILWSRGPATAEAVREALRPDHPLKDSSVRTLLRRLEARGHVKHRADDKVFVYEAAVQRHGMAARAVRQVIDRFWAGSTEQFLLGMVDERVLSAQEIERLARKIRSRR
jgi:BlaI family penicillinase repressor